MKIKVAEYIADFLVKNGTEYMFTVTGGGAMHLNDAFGHKKGLKCIYNHHEQACAIAAEGYARYTGKIAAVCVTSGPGGTNAITGVLGGWQDSIPMFVVSGQVKRATTTWSTDVPLRQLGDQEFQIVECVSHMTKYAVMVTKPEEIRYHLEKAWYLANNGRKGPVWIDVPVDVQAALVDTENLYGMDEQEKRELEEKEKPKYNKDVTEKVFEKLKDSKRPVILAGTGIRLSGAYSSFRELADTLQIPVVTAWNAHDLIEQEYPYYVGRPGSVGTRGGNFVVQNCDLLIVIGCRMNIRQISYNYEEFAKNAYKIVVDIDEAELRKPTVKVDMPVHADAADVMREWADYAHSISWNASDKLEWINWCKAVDSKYPAAMPSYYKNYKKQSPVNPYVYIDELSKYLTDCESVICGNGSACVVTFQTIKVKKGQRIFTNSGCAAMGYGFPAAIGVAFARKGERVVCIDGDGSFQMNLQELQTVVHHNLNLKIIIMNNNGYHSIRQTQTNLFKPPLVGVSEDNGISFPELEKLMYAYGIKYYRISDHESIKKVTAGFLAEDGPALCEVICDPAQNFEPKLSSKVMPDGSVVSPPIDDMFPFLSREEYMSNKIAD